MTTLYADNLTASEISNKLNALGVGGGTLVLPAGVGTYTANLGLMHSNILQGAGIGQTILNLDGGITNYISHPRGLKDLTINLVSGSEIINSAYTMEHGPIAVFKRVAFNCQVGFTTTHHFIQPSPGLNEHPHAVFSECTFFNCRILVIGITSSALEAGGNDRWAEDSVIGTGDGHIIIENCQLINDTGFGNYCDGNRGAKIQFRYNYCENRYFELHSVQQEANRGTRSWEIYRNVFHTTYSQFLPFHFRAGTGVIHNNNYTGPWTVTGGAFDNIRSYAVHSYPPGNGDGGSDWDENTPTENGHRLRDQIGTGKDNPGTFPTAGQAHDPAYLWDNTYEGNPVEVSIINNGNDVKTGGSSADIVEGRDYHEGTVKPGYTEFTYPHPAAVDDGPPGSFLLLGSCLT